MQTRTLMKRLALCALLGLACAQQPTTSPAANSGAGAVDPSSGGIVRLSTELVLSVPSASVGSAMEIRVESIADLPSAPADGFEAFGQAYRFSPAGTQFSLEHPAQLTMAVDVSRLQSRGLDPASTQLFYFDEGMGRYLAVPSTFDPLRGELRASIEHFTIYLPMARSLVLGNFAPVVLATAPFPNPIRAGAPIHIRATARDHTAGGSISGVRLHFRRPGGPVATLTMARQVGAEGTYAATVPAGFVSSPTLGPGNDFEYWIEAVDNLGASSQTAPIGVDVTRSFATGTVTLAPNAQSIAAGFERVFAVNGRDDLNVLFPFVAEGTQVSGDVGEVVSIDAAGVRFSAQGVGTGVLTARFDTGAGFESGTAAISVYPGEVAEIEVLDSDGLPLPAVPQLREGREYEVDVVGRDPFGNTVLVLPTSMVFAPEPGAIPPQISPDGVINTTSANAFSRLDLTLGTVTASRWFHVAQRALVERGTSPISTPVARLSLARADALYAAIADSELRVVHLTPTGWPQLGPSLGPINLEPNRNDESMDLQVDPSGYPWITWTGPGQLLHVSRFNGTDWMPVGEPLNFGPGSAAYYPSLAFVGGVAHVAFVDNMNQPWQFTLVKRWNGSTWELVGNTLNTSSAYFTWHPSITDHEGQPYVAFNEGRGHGVIVVRHWDGTNWVLDANELNDPPGVGASSPVIAGRPGRPLTVVWAQGDGIGVTGVLAAELGPSGFTRAGAFTRATPSPSNVLRVRGQHTRLAMTVVVEEQIGSDLVVSALQLTPTGWEFLNSNNTIANTVFTGGSADLCVGDQEVDLGWIDPTNALRPRIVGLQ
ncbi:MAG: hypothetical protein IPG45_16010 [Deltaproteobacteria bacterium]|nr:hypothetical protein [Deltaproteobacteria bacterium]